jgi:hypothetical protein
MIPAREAGRPDVALIQVRNLAYAAATNRVPQTFRAVPSQRVSPLGAELDDGSRVDRWRS